MDTTQDNTDVQLLSSNAFDHQLQAIDVALANKIKNSSSSNPLVLQAVHQLEKELPLFNRLRIEDWTFDDGQLYRLQNMAPTFHSLHWNLLEQRRNIKSTKSSITKALLQEGST